jgi:hypothetical protein
MLPDAAGGNGKEKWCKSEVSGGVATIATSFSKVRENRKKGTQSAGDGGNSGNQGQTHILDSGQMAATQVRNPHTNSTSVAGEHTSLDRWHPISPPRRRQTDHTTSDHFHAYMLLPGISLAFHAATLKRSRTSIATYRGNALAAIKRDPSIQGHLQNMLRNLSAEDGLEMARCRGSAQLPNWSRLAIREYHRRGLKQHELAAAFCCSRRTIVNVLRGAGRSYRLMSGDRILTLPQQSPPGRFRSR